MKRTTVKNMKIFRFNSIQSRISTWLLIVALLPLIVILVFTYYQRVAVIQSRTVDKITAIRDLKVQQVNNWLDERKRDLYVLREVGVNALADLELLSNYSPSDTAYTMILDRSRSLLNNYKNNNSAYDELFIVHPETGEILVSTNKDLEGYDASNREFFTGALKSKGIFIKDIYYSIHMLEHTMTYSIKFNCSLHNENHITGILGARIDLHNSLYKLLLDRTGLGKTGENLIVNKDVMALNDLRWYDDAPLNLRISAEPAVAAANGNTGVTNTSDYRGENVLAAYTYIPVPGWGFVCKQDLRELNKPIHELINSFIIIFIFASIIVGLVAMVISRTIAKPIIEMDNVVEKARAGDYSIRNIISKKDETGKLGIAFNEMMDAIAIRHEEQKIIANITESMIDISDLNNFGNTLINKIIASTGAVVGAFYILSENTTQFELITSAGTLEQNLDKKINVKNSKIEFKNAILHKKITYIKRIPKNTKFKIYVDGKPILPYEIATIPIIVENSVIAIFTFASKYLLKKESKNILNELLNTINAYYSNFIARERTKIFAEQLSRINIMLEEQSEELKDTSDVLKDRNKELEEQKNMVEAANKELEAFSYSVSHDLRAPLRAIDGFTRILIEDYTSKLDKEGKRLGSTIHDNTMKMGKLIDDLLAFSRVGRASITNTKIDMKNMVNAMYHEATSAEERNRIKFSITDLPHVEGDTNLMRQVWMNLISNAVKFSSNRKKAIISVSSKEEKNKVTYCIKDNGAGFNMKYVDKLFGVFQRLHSEKDFKGTGIGLSLVQRIIQRHDGKVWAEGKIDKGAAFYFSLPKK